MSSADTLDLDALCHAARDISRHIAGLSEELAHLLHAGTADHKVLVDRQIATLRNQVTLLTAIVGDLEKSQA